MTGNDRLVKGNVLGFEGKFSLCSEWLARLFLGLKSTLFELIEIFCFFSEIIPDSKY